MTVNTYSTRESAAPMFTYDGIGNPTDMFGLQFSWQGRQLTNIVVPDDPYYSNIAYQYNIDGQRVSKALTATDGTAVTTEYFYNGEILAGQKTGNDTLVFMYDNNGDYFGFTVNGTPYYYVKNAQNDVTAITDADGNIVGNYYYDEWGACTTGHTFGISPDVYQIVNANPIRYRSYYCDIETGFYFLNTRYYVPMLFRFLNADGYAQTGQGMLDKNMFAYCGNNPVNRSDSGGSSWKDVKDWFSNKWNALKSWASSTFGTESAAVFVVDSNPAADLSNLAPFSATSGVRTTTQIRKINNTSKPVVAYGKVRQDAKTTSSVGIKISFKNNVINLSLGLDNIGISKTNFSASDYYSTVGVKMDLTRMQIGVETSETKISWTDDKQVEVTDYIYYNVSLAWLYAVFAVATAPSSGMEPSGNTWTQRQPA